MIHKTKDLLFLRTPYKQHTFSLVEVMLALTLVALGASIGGTYWYKQKQTTLHEIEQLESILKKSHQLMATYALEVKLTIEYAKEGTSVTVQTTPPLSRASQYPLIPAQLYLPNIQSIEYGHLLPPFTLLFQPKGASFSQGSLTINDTYSLQLPSYINAPTSLHLLSESYIPPSQHTPVPPQL